MPDKENDRGRPGEQIQGEALFNDLTANRLTPCPATMATKTLDPGTLDIPQPLDSSSVTGQFRSMPGKHVEVEKTTSRAFLQFKGRVGTEVPPSLEAQVAVRA